MSEDRWNVLYEVREVVKQGNYVVIDCETTSLSGEIVQWCIVAPDGTILGQGLVKPQGRITEGAFALHHISNEMLSDAPTFDQVAEQIWALLEGKTVVGYNASFEKLRLYTSLCAVSGPWPQQNEQLNLRLDWLLYHVDWRCAMEWFAVIYGAWHSYFKSYTWQKLQWACRYFTIPVEDEHFHDAAVDARATAAIVRKMADLAEQELPEGYHPPRAEPCAGGCGKTLGLFSYDEDPTWYCAECGLVAGVNCLCPRCQEQGRRTIVSRSDSLCEPVAPGTLCYHCRYETNMASGDWHLCPRCTRVVEAPDATQRYCASCQQVREERKRERRERKERRVQLSLEECAQMAQAVRKGAVQLLEEQPVAEALVLAQSQEPITHGYLVRGEVEPVLVQSESPRPATLVLRRQGKYREFQIPYIENLVLYADLHLVAVLVAFHTDERYRVSRGKYRVTAKGQFYRFYVRDEASWRQVSWKQLRSEDQALLIATYRAKAPPWARPPAIRSKQVNNPEDSP